VEGRYLGYILIKIAIIQYPGTNCEWETKRAVEAVGMEGVIFRWNESAKRLKEYQGYIIPGGFSYQDRVRAGAVAAKQGIIEEIAEQAERGKPVLGICNGAQVLVEAGLVPHFDEKVALSIAPNLATRGFWCDWVYLKVASKKSLFVLDYKEDEVIPMPIAHAEGRFLTIGKILSRLKREALIILRYCDCKGRVKKSFPINPNGSLYNAAAVSNKEGNVLAMMPHPERATFFYQIPHYIEDKKDTSLAPAARIFLSMKRYLS
jgi:phosphoribosylformylglycinamidine synthase